MKTKLLPALAFTAALLTTAPLFAHGGPGDEDYGGYIPHATTTNNAHYGGGYSPGAYSSYYGNYPFAYGFYTGITQYGSLSPYSPASAANNLTTPNINMKIQGTLAQLGYYRGPLDGNLAPGSPAAAAIASYQRDHHLPITGTIDGGLIASLSGN